MFFLCKKKIRNGNEKRHVNSKSTRVVHKNGDLLYRGIFAHVARGTNDMMMAALKHEERMCRLIHIHICKVLCVSCANIKFRNVPRHAKIPR